VDRVYKQDIPAARRTLEKLVEQFSRLDSKTDWTALRIEPLLDHAKTLERLLRRPRFSRETARLPRGVSMFHADLVYFRDNIKTLQAILASARKPRTIRKAET
jgi:hypothetical protein